MTNLFSSNYLANRPIELAMKTFAKQFVSTQKILDIGCGHKPYRRFFHSHYYGVDVVPLPDVDYVAPAWHIPVDSASFDGVVLNQSLEHITKTVETIAEIKRILKPGGKALISVPHTVHNHGERMPLKKAPFPIDSSVTAGWQDDFYRFTRYGLLYLCRDFKVLSLVPTTGFWATQLQLTNYFWAQLQLDWLFRPLYAVNNCLGLAADGVAKLLLHTPFPTLHRFYSNVYDTLTINYIMVIQKHE